jgi:siroheme synthase
VIQQGTLPTQRVVRATLATLPERVRVAGFVPPTLIVVGDVVALSETLATIAPSQGALLAAD